MKVLSDILHQAGILKQAAESYSSGGYTVVVRNATTGRLQNVSPSVVGGVNSVFGRTGAVVAVAGDYNTDLVTEGGNLYFTNARSRSAISLTTSNSSGASTYNSSTGVLNVPNYTLSGLGGEPAIASGTTSQYWRGDKSWQTLDTSVVPENGSIYFTEPRVRGTVLAGLNLTGGGSITASDSILTAFGKVQNQISAMVGGVIYQGVWNASTNTPTITSSIGTKGQYYVVSVAGTTTIDSINDWKVGDWIIFNGSTWDKVDNTDAVSSVNGFTGAVSLGLSNIIDVNIVSPTNGQLLRFNGTNSKWENWTSNYLPLTGGTLTGALSGTSATFSGVITGDSFQGTGATTSSINGHFEILNGKNLYLYNTGSTTYWWARNNANTFELKYGASLTPLSISSTGAATFSSSVSSPGVAINATPTSLGTAQSYIRYLNTGADFYVGIESSTNGGFFTGSTAYDSVLYSTTAQNFIIGGVSRLRIASTGAATFTSTLSSGQATFSATQATASVINKILSGSINDTIITDFQSSGGVSYAYLSTKILDNNTVSRHRGELSFFVRKDNASYSQALVIKDDGTIGINESNPISTLHLTSSSSNGTTVRMVSTSTNGRSYAIGSNFVNGVGEFAIYDYTAGAERIRITSTGVITVANLAGTGNRIVGADASGNLSSITVGSGLSLSGGTLTATGGASGTVTGSGANSQIAYWTSASNISGSSNYVWDNTNGQLRINTSNWPTSVIGNTAGRHIMGGSNSPILLLWNEATAAANNYSGVIVGAKSATGATYFGGGSVIGALENATDSSGYLSFRTTGTTGSFTERLIITSNGLVGIGTTPSYQLEVSLPSGSNGQIIRMNRSAGAYGWGIGIDSSSNFNIYDNGNNIRFGITSGGNVGIGISSNLNGYLDVYGAGGSTGTSSSLTIRNGNIDTYFGNNQIVLGYAGSTNYAHAIKTRHNSVAATSNAIDIYTWKYGDTAATIAGQHVMTIQANGVGIGTTSPSNILSIAASTNSGSGSTYPLTSISNTLATQGDGSTTFNFAGLLVQSGNGTVQSYFSTSYAAGTWEPQALINVATNHPLIIRTNNTERLRISNTGAATFSSGSNAQNVIIQSTNTGSSATTLQISNSSNSAFNDGVKMIQGAGVFKIQDLAGANLLAFDLTNTRVGIGTTSPVTNLEVSGAIGATGLRYSNIPTKQGVYLGNSASSPGSTSYATIEMCGGTAGGCEIDFTKPNVDWSGRIAYDLASDYMTFGTSATERMRITSGGDVIAINTIRSKIGFNLYRGDASRGGVYDYASISGAGTDYSTTIFSETGQGIYFAANGSATRMMTLTSGGLLNINDTANTTYRLYVNGSVGASGGFFDTSDYRVKDIIERNPALDINVDLVKYTKKGDSKVRYGYIAQEVQAINSDVVEGSDILSLNYQDIHSIKIAALEKEIRELKARLNDSN